METGKRRDALEKRPQLRAALDTCRKNGARLLIAKLDRLARNVAFISGLMESKVKFVACDMPEANELTTHFMAAFAQHEAQLISDRMQEALHGGAYAHMGGLRCEVVNVPVLSAARVAATAGLPCNCHATVGIWCALGCAATCW